MLMVRWLKYLNSGERCDINETHPGRELEKKSTNPVYFETCDRHNIVLSTGGCMYFIRFLGTERIESEKEI